MRGRNDPYPLAASLHEERQPARCSIATRRAALLALVLGCATCESGCEESQPYGVRLHVVRDSDCHLYEDILRDAVDFWALHGVAAFEYEGCDLDDFVLEPTFYQAAGSTAKTDDLPMHEDHVPIYVVDWILLDESGTLSELRGATAPGQVVACPGLVAIDLASVGLMAHELGHLLWLDHDEMFGNVMYPSRWPEDSGEIVITEAQIDDATYNFDLCNRRTHQ